tara:strand:+ start:165 stop:479 length:315 start_codon:yes stop_codon:yes gene_type:complete
MDITSAQVNVPSAGNRVRVVTTTTPVKWVRFKALEGNTGAVYVGGVTVASTTGWTLYDSQMAMNPDLELNPGLYGGTVDLSDFYVDAANNDDKVEYFAIISRSA